MASDEARLAAGSSQPAHPKSASGCAHTASAAHATSSAHAADDAGAAHAASSAHPACASGSSHPALQAAPARGRQGSLREDAESAARRRAKNAVWNAAGDYAVATDDLAATGVRAVDLYRNTASGLIAKHYGSSLPDLRRTWHEDYRANAFDTVAWFAFEAAAFAAETAERPALAELRANFLASLDSDERAIARAVAPEASAPEPAAAIEARIRAALHARYRFDGTVVKAPQASLHLGLSLLGLSMRSRRDRRSGIASTPADAALRASSKPGRLRRALAERADERRRTRAERDRAYIEARFGAPLYPPAVLERLERDLCTGAHEGCRLWISDGAAQAVPEPSPELSALARAADEQFRANRVFYEGNRRAFDAAANRLARALADRLHSVSTFTEKHRTRGCIEAPRAWRLALLNDDRVFSRRVPSDELDVAVDLLLDASGSRSDACAAVAAQAYIVGKSLAKCGIDVRLWAFSSMRGYTVLRLFNHSTADAELAHVFRYTASGMNRDGLALRCVGALAPARASDRRLVLMLTDAAPMDDVGMVREDDKGTRTTVDYNGRAAVNDTAQTVRDLRRDGIAVGALFDGEDTFFDNARLMFGHDFMRVRRIERMADSCAALVANALERSCR